MSMVDPNPMLFLQVVNKPIQHNAAAAINWYTLRVLVIETLLCITEQQVFTPMFRFIVKLPNRIPQLEDNTLPQFRPARISCITSDRVCTKSLSNNSQKLLKVLRII